KPTDHALAGPRSSTSRSSPPPGGRGFCDMRQRLPSQRRITGLRVGSVPVSARPTAHACVAEEASDPQRTLSNWLALGLFVSTQVAAQATRGTSTARNPKAAATFFLLMASPFRRLNTCQIRWHASALQAGGRLRKVAPFRSPTGLGASLRQARDLPPEKPG